MCQGHLIRNKNHFLSSVSPLHTHNENMIIEKFLLPMAYVIIFLRHYLALSLKCDITQKCYSSARHKKFTSLCVKVHIIWVCDSDLDNCLVSMLIFAKQRSDKKNRKKTVGNNGLEEIPFKKIIFCKSKLNGIFLCLTWLDIDQMQATIS